MKKKASLLVVMAAALTVLSGPAVGQWTEPVPVDEINTQYDEWTPFLSYDGLTLYFARGRIGGTNFRIYQATRDEPFGPFASVTKIGSLTASGDVWGPWVSPDSLRMYYSDESSGRYRLKLSKRPSIDDPWPNGTGIPELNALGNQVMKPSLSLTPGELIIVFGGYDLPGGQGGYDIWMATRPDTDSPFGDVRNLTEINTAAYDSGPCLSGDGLTLYFHSNRNGQWELFKTTRTSLEEPFGPPEHLSFFDTPGGHSSMPCVTSDSSAFYFRRNLDGQQHDIYVSYRIVEPVAIDIKPGSCPNPLNLASRGVLPVAILGSEEFDVAEIDATTASLAGVGAVRSGFEDVTGPVTDGNECDCTEEGPDSYLDLTLKFKTAEVAAELLNLLGEVDKGEVLVLPLVASLYDGTPIEGEDCVVVVGKAPRALAAKKADVDGNGIVNIYDFAVIADYWLEYAVVDY